MDRGALVERFREGHSADARLGLCALQYGGIGLREIRKLKRELY